MTVQDVKRNPRFYPGVSFKFVEGVSFSAKNRHVCRLQSFRTLRNLKLHLIAFVKGLKPVLFDGGEVYEDIASVISGDEPIALLLIKPLYTTFGHYNSPPFFI